MKIGGIAILAVRGMEEVVTALEQLKPQGSLIRIARFEPINVTLPFREEGYKHVTVRMLKLPRVLPLPRGKEAMSYRVAAIDIHKNVVMVVVATAAQEVEDPTAEALEFECRRFGTGHSERMQLVSWLGGATGDRSGDGKYGASTGSQCGWN
jgi:hypothetical protein